MLHRVEPDDSNARYWFRQVGEHHIFPELLQGAREEARGQQSEKESAAIAIQMV